MSGSPRWRLVERGTGRVVVEDLQVADGFWSRLAGLQFRSHLGVGRGLLLVPCSSAHTMFMRFPIDAVMVDGSGRVTEVRRHVYPWRLVLPRKRAHAILEVASGQAGVEPGAVLGIEEASQADAGLPRSLRFLSHGRADS
jgi:uncharacterized membrane protein (UPF0127 family)